jgi:hypothetical protein
MASGLNGTFRVLGVAIGVPALAAIVEGRVSSSLGAAPSGLVDVVATGDVAAAAAQPGAGPGAAAAAEQAFVSGLDTIFLVAALIAFAGAALALTLVRSGDLVAGRAAGPLADPRLRSSPEIDPAWHSTSPTRRRSAMDRFDCRLPVRLLVTRGEVG